MEDGQEGRPPPGRKRKGPEADIAAKYRRGPEVATRRVSAGAGGRPANFTLLAAAAAAASLARCCRLPSQASSPHSPQLQIEDKKLKGKLRYTERLVADAQQAAAKVRRRAAPRPAAAGATGCGAAPCRSRVSRSQRDCPHCNADSSSQSTAAGCLLPAAPQVEEWLLPAEPGELEAEGMERTWRFSQADIVQVPAGGQMFIHCAAWLFRSAMRPQAGMVWVRAAAAAAAVSVRLAALHATCIARIRDGQHNW